MWPNIEFDRWNHGYCQGRLSWNYAYFLELWVYMWIPSFTTIKWWDTPVHVGIRGIVHLYTVLIFFVNIWLCVVITHKNRLIKIILKWRTKELQKTHTHKKRKARIEGIIENVPKSWFRKCVSRPFKCSINCLMITIYNIIIIKQY